MKIIKTVISFAANIYALILLFFLAFALFIGNHPFWEAGENTFFKTGTLFIKLPTAQDNAVIVTIPKSDAAKLDYDPGAVPYLAGFLHKLKSADPAAVALIVNCFPHTLQHFPSKQGSASAKRLKNALSGKNMLIAVKQTAGAKSPGPLLSSPGGYSTDIGLKYQEASKKIYLKQFSSPPELQTFKHDYLQFTKTGRPTFTAVPAFFSETPFSKKPLLYKLEAGYIPDLASILCARFSNSKEPVWVNGEGLIFGNRLVKTDIHGRIWPLIPSETPGLKAVSVFPIKEISREKNISFLHDKIVFVGIEGDAALADIARTALSVISGEVIYTPLWGILLVKIICVVLFLYLVILLPRIETAAGLVLNAFILLAIVALQFGIFAALNQWLPFSTPAVFLVFGYAVIMMGLKKDLRLRQDAHRALAELGSYQFRQNEFDRAFETLRKSRPTDEVLELIYKTGNAYEKRRQYEKAHTIFKYIATQKQDFKDAAERADNLADSENGTPPDQDGPPGNRQVIRPGSVLGRYEIIRELGSGAMGIVYLGKDPKIGREVAIKTLDFSQSFDRDIEEIKNRFFREAESVGKLNHPNIITVYDVGDEKDLAYIAMDYVPGKTLGDYGMPENLLPVDTVYRMITQVAEALDYAHRQGIVHRDIKPNNIIYNDNDRLVKVTDFGIARISDNTMTKTGIVLGSPLYMSPEQLKGAKVDGRADIFSLGVTFFQMLTGDLPFKSTDLASLAYQIANEKHPSVRGKRPELPKSAETIIDRALQKDPAKRYVNAKNMATSLRKGMRQL